MYDVFYNDVIIGSINRDFSYTPIKNSEDEIFNFLKNSIEDVRKIAFFENRIKNCSRFINLPVIESSGDKYVFIRK